MKKIFSFCAALCMAFAASAAVINITPTSPQPADNLRLAMASAQAGDTIVMAEGTYEESNGNYLAFDKNLAVVAAEGANVTLKPHVSITISSGSKALIKGIKIDAAGLNSVSAYDHLIYAADETAGNQLFLEGCEICNYPNNNSAIHASSSAKLDSIFINNCYIHNNDKSFVFGEGESISGLFITNSTFANQTANVTDSYWAGHLDVRSSAAKILIDYCTFYNVNAMNSDYGAIGYRTNPSTNVKVLNSIFVMPTGYSGSIRAIYLPGGEVKNCLTLNYTKDSNTGIHSGPTISDCIHQDPLFVDAANGDFHLGAGSPAFGAGLNGSDLGDPRWLPEPEYRTIYCKIASDWWKYDANGQPVNTVGAYVWGQGIANLAEWPGVKMEAVEGEIDTWSIELDTRYANIVFTRVGPSGNYEGIKTPDLVIPDSNNLYTIAAPTPDWSSPNHEMLADSDGTWSVFVPYVPMLVDGYYLIGKINGDTTATWTVADLDSTRLFVANDGNEGEFMLEAELADGDEFQVVSVARDVIGNWFPGGESKNYKVDALHAGKKTIYFRADGQGGDDWWEKCIYVAPNESAIDMTKANVKVVKMIQNGRLYIIRAGVRYNALGQQE